METKEGRGNAALQATTESQVYRVSQVNQDLQDIRHMVQGASDHRWPGSQMEKWDLKP